MKKRFQVMAGQHIERVGEHGKKVYTKDDVVVSDQDLLTLFPNKFIDLGPAPEPAVVAKTPNPVIPPDDKKGRSKPHEAGNE